MSENDEDILEALYDGPTSALGGDGAEPPASPAPGDEPTADSLRRLSVSSTGSGGGGGGGPSDAASLGAAEVMELLSSSKAEEVKKGLFRALLDRDVAADFLARGGLDRLAALAPTLSGNSLAYAVDAYRLAFRACGDESLVDRTLLDFLLTHLDSGKATNVTKGVLELLLLLNSSARSVFAAAATRPGTLAILAGLLQHSADIDVQRRSLTVLNAALATAAPGDERDALYKELWENTLVHRALASLRASEDGLIRVQMCAFQVGRLDSIRRRKETKFEKGNAAHEALLLQLWDSTFPDEPLPAREGKHWAVLGFQGTDPSTDFRGMGLLGLDTLLFFAGQYGPEWRALIQRNVDRGAEREYPVAVAAINACKVIDDVFGFVSTVAGGQDLLLHPLLLDAAHPFEELHANSMRILDRLWDVHEADYMKFPVILELMRQEFVDSIHHYSTFDAWTKALKAGREAPSHPDGSGAAQKQGSKRMPGAKRGSKIVTRKPSFY